MKAAKTVHTAHFTPRATLAAIGVKLRTLDLLAPIRDKVKINQKTIKHEPFDKLQDALITILAGAHGLYEINTRLRSDPALQRAFDREACADQSVVQDTLNACTLTNERRKVEVEIKESKQGIGINKRSKKRFAAQQMVILLGSLAHNILVWSRWWLTSDAPRFAKYGALRIVRDLFHINGLLEFNDAGQLLRITLNKAAPFAREITSALDKLWTFSERMKTLTWQ